AVTDASLGELPLHHLVSLSEELLHLTNVTQAGNGDRLLFLRERTGHRVPLGPVFCGGRRPSSRPVARSRSTDHQSSGGSISADSLTTPSFTPPKVMPSTAISSARRR